MAGNVLQNKTIFSDLDKLQLDHMKASDGAQTPLAQLGQLICDSKRRMLGSIEC